MSNILRTSQDLKKKLSFNDYNSTSPQNIEAPQLKEVDQNIKRGKGTSKLELKNSIASKSELAQETQAQVDSLPKIKATYYLSENDYHALIEVYIKRLQNRHRVDKSALISEAIRLLHKNEINK